MLNSALEKGQYGILFEMYQEITNMGITVSDSKAGVTFLEELCGMNSLFKTIGEKTVLRSLKDAGFLQAWFDRSVVGN